MTQEQVKHQIANLNELNKFLVRREIKHLSTILWETETIKGLVSTNNRLIFLDKKLLNSIYLEDFPYDKISTVQYENGLLFNSLIIFEIEDKSEIRKVDKYQTQRFSESIRAYIPNKSQFHTFNGLR